MNRAAFFAAVRTNLFAGHLSQSQVDGMNAILDEWEAQGLTDHRWLAYMLATPMIETGGSFEPMTENLNYSAKRMCQVWPQRFPTVTSALPYEHNPEKLANRVYAGRMGNGSEASGDGWKFRGRGLCQITGKDNYAKFGIAATPDKAAELPTAVKIMVVGMVAGTFTGKKLADYFHGNTTDWLNARRIINGLDRANDIAAHATKFYAAIEAAA
jgi:putative chitinase